MVDMKLDRGDMYADFCGAFVGSSLLVVRNMEFELGKDEK
jgi:hypothetical protein